MSVATAFAVLKSMHRQTKSKPRSHPFSVKTARSVVMCSSKWMGWFSSAASNSFRNALVKANLPTSFVTEKKINYYHLIKFSIQSFYNYHDMKLIITVVRAKERTGHFIVRRRVIEINTLEMDCKLTAENVNKQNAM